MIYVIQIKKQQCIKIRQKNNKIVRNHLIKFHTYLLYLPTYKLKNIFIVI